MTASSNNANSTIYEGLLSIAEAARSAAIEDGVVADSPAVKEETEGLDSSAPTQTHNHNSATLDAKVTVTTATGRKAVLVDKVLDSTNFGTADTSSQKNTVTASGPKSKPPNPLSSSASTKATSSNPRSSSNNSAASTAAAGTNASSASKRKGPLLRRGKWTMEEEAYANRLIMEFKSGLLPLTDGTTLRTFLSKLLNCDPMRISKKFVGGNCIGKQVFRRRTAEINRLTPEQIKQSKMELSDLERRFLDRVAQTTKVKTPGPSGSASNTGTTNGTHTNTPSTTIPAGATIGKQTSGDVAHDSTLRPSTPPWLRTPAIYKPGNGAALASMAQGRSGSYTSTEHTNHSLSKKGLGVDTSRKMYPNSNALLSHQTNPQTNHSVTHGFAQRNDSIGDELAQTILSQLLAHHNSNAQLNNDTLARDNSMVDAILQTAMSHEHINQLVRDGTLNSSISLTNIIQRQSSLDALLSLDLQSLNSTDNLASLVQTTNTGTNQLTKGGLKSSLGIDGADLQSFGNISSFVNARRLASGGHLGHLISSLSTSTNGGNKMSSGLSAVNFPSFLQNTQSHPSSSLNNSSNSTLSTATAAAAANTTGDMNMLRVNSSTGLTALRIQDGLGQRNSSVEDFLSLMASGDIPHQDPHLLNVPFHGHFQLLHQNNSQQQPPHLNTNNALNFQIISNMEDSEASSTKKRKITNGIKFV